MYIKSGKLYLPSGGASRRILASYNAASVSPDMLQAFAGSDSLSADAAMRRSARLLIASRARNEFANNSFAYGIVTTLANDTVGRGPKLQLFHPDDDAAYSPRQEEKLQRRERRFRRWCRQVGMNSLLRCARIAKALDGETFIVMAENLGAKREIQLQPQIFEAECVQSSSWKDQPDAYHRGGEPVEVDGIRFDQWGNPISYRFLTVHPGSAGAFPSEGREIPAASVLHYANRFRAGQHRGISEMLAALNIFNDLRRYSTAVVLSAEIAARISFIISNDLPAEAYEDSILRAEDGTVTTALDLQGGPASFQDGPFNSLVLPAGYRASQMQPQQPTNNYVTFRDAKIAEAARVFSMPFNVAAGNSSSYNYASGRLDHQVYHKAIQIERTSIEEEILLPLYQAWERRDATLHLQDYKGVEDALPTIMWDGFEHVDPVKEANAQQTRLASGTTTLAEECAREGKDYATVIRQRKREMDTFLANGLPVPAWFTGPYPSQSNGNDNDNDNDNKDKENE